MKLRHDLARAALCGLKMMPDRRACFETQVQCELVPSKLQELLSQACTKFERSAMKTLTCSLIAGYVR